MYSCCCISNRSGSGIDASERIVTELLPHGFRYATLRFGFGHAARWAWRALPRAASQYGEPMRRR